MGNLIFNMLETITGVEFTDPEHERNLREQKRYKQALDNYNYRVKHYSWWDHGDINAYRERIHAQYQLECLPSSVRYGTNYSGW